MASDAEEVTGTREAEFQISELKKGSKSLKPRAEISGTKPTAEVLFEAKQLGPSKEEHTVSFGGDK
jgi:hypothetical protein